MSLALEYMSLTMLGSLPKVLFHKDLPKPLTAPTPEPKALIMSITVMSIRRLPPRIPLPPSRPVVTMIPFKLIPSVSF